jgi:MAP/microtubule affinity-regulating kinase
MAHRDIKLENILLTKEYEIKIIDFGFGMLNPENKIQYFFCGTPNYMPPEIIEKKGYIGQKADLWSLGILVYKIYCADFPFKGKTEKELYQSIKNNQFNIISYVPDDVKKIIKALIEYQPNKRASCKEVLKSQWLKS